MASLRKRGPIFYAQVYVGGRQTRISLQTDSLQVAKEKLRQLESAQVRGDDALGLPTRTPIPDALAAYVAHIRATKTAKSAQTDGYYLRDAFGPVCEALKINSRKATTRKRPLLPGAVQDRRRRAQVIEANCLEQITTAQVSAFIAGQVQSRGLAPKTANRYREILCRLFNWSTTQRGVKLPGDKNPAAQVERYREHAPEIRFLTIAQIDEQLQALRFKPALQTMVATLIYAGLRREELLWLTVDDLDRRAGGRGMLRVRAKTVDGESWQPKTKVNRGVPISSALLQHLDRYTPRPAPGDWLFPSPDGNRWDPDNFSQDLRAANTEAGLVWGSLDFRHTFGSQLAQAGVSLFKIATLMGNSPEICRRHYAALVPDAMGMDVEFAGSPAVNSTLSSHTEWGRA
ncbi:MAG: tyrosine-type recombinase/integrase [Planctomycetota bacterium]|nr:tyrosine-type recombinase/integrase [Planctomycetota bacterium]